MLISLNVVNMAVTVLLVLIAGWGIAGAATASVIAEIFGLVLGVVAGLCDEVNVLYGGRIVERGARHPLFRDPRHPYTNGLLGSIPRLDAVGERLTPIPGSVADNLPWDHACAFAPRCSQPIERCTQVTPVLEESFGRALRCHNPVEVPR